MTTTLSSPASQLHQVLFSCPSREENYAEFERLHKLYLTTFKRAMSAELYIAQWGPIEKPVYGVTAYWSVGQESEVEWLKKAVFES